MSLALDVAQLVAAVASSLLAYSQWTVGLASILASTVSLAIAYNLYAYARLSRENVPPYWLLALTVLAYTVLTSLTPLRGDGAAATATLLFAVTLFALGGPKALPSTPASLYTVAAVATMISAPTATLLAVGHGYAPLLALYTVMGPFVEVAAAHILALEAGSAWLGRLPALVVIALLPGYTPLLESVTPIAVYTVVAYTVKAFLEPRDSLRIAVVDQLARLALLTVYTLV